MLHDMGALDPAVILVAMGTVVTLAAGISTWAALLGLRANRRRENRLRAKQELTELVNDLQQPWREHAHEPGVQVSEGGRYELGAALGLERGLLERYPDSRGNTMVRMVKQK